MGMKLAKANSMTSLIDKIVVTSQVLSGKEKEKKSK